MTVRAIVRPIVRPIVRGVVGGLGSADAVILDAFANGEDGLWLAPRYTNTIYQDSAGSAAWAAIGNPAGIILDKHASLAVGSNLVSNGSFSTDTVWNKGVGWSIAGGVATASAPSNSSQYLSQTLPGFVAGLYEVTYTVSRYVAGQIRPVAIGTATHAGTTRTSAGTFTDLLMMDAGTAGVIRLQPVSGPDCDFDVDNVSARRIAGNHFTQATSANRPATASVGGNIVLRGNGTTTGMSAGDVLDLRTGSAFAVCVAKFATSGAGQALFGKTEAGATNGRYWINRDAAGNLNASLNDGVLPEAEVADTSTALRVISVVWDRATGLITLRVNGAEADTTAFAVTGADLNTTLPYHIMIYDGSIQSLNGDFHELVQVMRLPETGELAAIEARLAAVHGVTL